MGYGARGEKTLGKRKDKGKLKVRFVEGFRRFPSQASPQSGCVITLAKQTWEGPTTPCCIGLPKKQPGPPILMGLKGRKGRRARRKVSDIVNGSAKCNPSSRAGLIVSFDTKESRWEDRVRGVRIEREKKGEGAVPSQQKGGPEGSIFRRLVGR